MSCIEFTVNEKKCKVNQMLSRTTTLSAYIRYELSLPGTKAMCQEGGCGSCIVAVRARRYPSGQIETFSVNSCLVLVFSCHEWEVMTIEYIGNRLDGYSDEQKAFTELAASQCGFCTPGWIMHLHSLRHKNLTMAQMEKSFGSNTCRCTGYRPIMDAVKKFAVDASSDLTQRIKDIEDLKICNKTKTRCENKCTIKNEYSDWIIIEDCVESKIIALDYGQSKFYKVFEEDEIFEVLKKQGLDSYMLVDGNTGKGILNNYEYPRVLIDISGVKSLKQYNIDQNLILGANISLEDCIQIFTNIANSKSEFAYLTEFVKHFHLIAHIPVRTLGSLAGNLMMKRMVPTYQSDVFVLFEAVGAVVTVRDSIGKKTTLSMTAFLKYDMKGMLMVNFELPPLSDCHVFKSYKVMPRNQNALAIVNAAFLIKSDGTNLIEEISLVFGNIQPKFVHAKQTEAYLIGKNVFKNDVLQKAIQMLNSEVIPKPNPPEASVECRRKLAVGLFYKFVLNICPAGSKRSSFRTGGDLLTRPVSRGVQKYQTDQSLYPLNEPLTKLEAPIQCSGEARYSNDLPPVKNEVFAAFVQSTIHVGEVDQVITSDVLKIQGVFAVFTANDIPGRNSFTYPGIQLQTEDEEILAVNVKYYGQPVAIVVAESQELAARVAKKVKVIYKNVSTEDPVLTIDQAKKDSKRYISGDGTITPKGKGTKVTKVIKGVYEIEAQYHYYLEPLTCVVVPVDNRLEVYDSTQWIDLTQIAIAKCLGINESSVLVKVYRVGGGFGGKISRNVHVSTACALVAKKMDLPCRFILPMQTNLMIAGKRLPCQCDYEVGIDDDGKIQYLDATIIEDKGCTNNESILAYTADGFKNCYNPDYFTLKTANVLTDLPSNTFARAPGTAEGISSMEHIMEHIAFAVKKDPTAVRELNMRTDDNDLPQLIKLLKEESKYDERTENVRTYNQSNRWRKKAIHVSVMSFPVTYYGNYTLMMSVYRGDGSVTITTGGIEMGQGCNTKVAQVCAYKLGISVDLITVLSHYSFAAANDVFSGSSITTESVCYCAIKACDMINDRLSDIKDEMKGSSWADIIKTAGDRQVDLTAFYMMTDTDKNLHAYSAFAVCIMEVELDVITGRFEILRVDILEDCGLSANPKIDIGQVEGAFIQGIGYFTVEKLVYDQTTGKLLTNRSLYYHVPLAQDIPVDFRVELRFNYKNPNGVLGSKTCGEMGICTANGITHALRKCIHESRKDSGYDINKWQNISIPYDTESILKALDVKLEEFILN